MRKSKTSPIWALAAVAALGLGLAACSSSDDPPPPAPPPVDPGPSAYQTGKAAIMAAMTADAAQAAYDAIDRSEVSGSQLASLQMALSDRLAAIAADNAYADGRAAIMAAMTADAAQAAYDAIDLTAVSGEEAASLLMALNTRLADLAMMDRAETQKMALMSAAGMIDTSDMMTAAEIAAANTAIAALETALAAADDVSDADKAMYRARVTTAQAHIMESQRVLDHAAQTSALSAAAMALQAIDLSALSTQEEIDEAMDAIGHLRDALADAVELTAAEKTAATIQLQVADLTLMRAQGRFDRDSQRMALRDAIDAIGELEDGDALANLMTQAQIDAYEQAIAQLMRAIDAATDLADADKYDAIAWLQNSRHWLDVAQTALDENVGNQRTALTDAAAALQMIDLDNLDTPEKVEAADAAVMALHDALEGATHLSDTQTAEYRTQLASARETVRTAQTGMDLNGRMMTQRSAITSAVSMATTAVGKVNNTATDDQVTAADNAIAALQSAIDGAEDLPAGDAQLLTARATLTALTSVLNAAKTSRTAAMEAAEEERQRAANAAMAVTAAKLHTGIYTPAANATGTAVGEVHAAYNDADTPDSGTAADTLIMVTMGDDTAAITRALSEDKKTTVAALHGWAGKRYHRTAPATEGTYEARVYSHVGPAVEGDPFNEVYTAFVSATGLPLVTDNGATSDFMANRVASNSFDQGAGTKHFKLGSNDRAVMIPGSYHGVAGTYSCTVVAGGSCTVTKAAQGFTLSGVDADDAADATVDWVFKPSSATAKVMSVPDSSYASYGWWLHTATDGDLTASAFVDRKGATEAASGLDALNGTATYMGGAVGKYALTSNTGGTNDAGHFTARATLQADFTNNTDDTAITGTIDQFMGADGMPRDWTVKLNGSDIGDEGGIGNAGDGTEAVMTEWTIGGTAADDAGNWTGSLQENGDDDVPAIATGTFYSEYGTAGKMVGAFGANKQ